MAYFDFSGKHDILLRNPDGSLTPMDEPWYEAEQIAPKTWKILSAGDYSYLLAGDGEGLLIDSGYGAGNIREYCEQLCGLPVKWIANTHEHFDHTANNGYFDLVYLTEKAHERATMPFASFSGIDFPRDYPVRYVKTGDVIPLNGRPVEVFELADHAPGSAVYLDRASRILFSGDELWEEKALNGRPGDFLRQLEAIDARRDAFDVLWGGNGRHDVGVFDHLLHLCRRAVSGDSGERKPVPPRPDGPVGDRLPDGRPVYDRRRPRTGDGGKGGRRPDPNRMHMLAEDGISLFFVPDEA